MGRCKDYNGFLDSPQDIADCLSCRRPICMNCKEKSGIATGMSRKSIRDFEIRLVQVYPLCNTEIQLINTLQSNGKRIARVRKRLSLPEPSTVSAEERARFAKEASMRL